MAELLIFTKNKPKSGDVYIDRHRWLVGDVVVITADGHGWSGEERTSSFWRILKLPGVAVSALSQLTNPDLGYLNAEAEKLSRVLRRRPRGLDMAALVALLASPVVVVEISTKPAKALAYILALVTAKPVLVDPAVIGPAPSLVTVIG